MGDEDAADAFALLGSEVRLDVLRALAAAEREHGGDPGPYDVGFSTLYDDVDVDSTSAFAYHLDKLEGVFVEHTDDGYRLSDRGQRVVRAILAGTYTDRPEFGPVDLEGYCPACEATTLRATHGEDRLVIECSACGTGLLSEELTASQVAGRAEAAVLESIAIRIRAGLEQTVDGVCGACGGPVDATVDTIDGPSGTRWMFHGDCQTCERRINAPIEWCLFHHPSVAGFYWEHGVLLRDEPLWRAFRRIETDEWETSRTDAGFRCTVTLDSDELHLELDDQLTVLAAHTTETGTEPGTCRNPD